uniref:RNA-directed DNA polymerase n=1 Tax=Heterorhabditis bacteriophora TaxID=37862 RepID=A0A1I7WYG7_HETBA
MVVDYRKLNSITKKATYLLPRMDDIVDLIAGKLIYSSFDLTSGFWQIPLNPCDKYKTAFSTHVGTFQFTVLAMGLCGAPATFQSAMRETLRGLQATVYAYLDDVVLASDSADDHIREIDCLLQRLIISAKGCRPDPGKLVAIKEFPTPKSIKELQRFFGVCNFFSSIVQPLTELLRNDTKFIWTDVQKSAFDKLKDALTSSPVLMAPQIGQPYVIHTDASTIGIGAALYQYDAEKHLRPIAFCSRTLNKAEKRYSIIELESLFHPYVFGAQILLFTDHKPLKSLLFRSDLQGRLAKYQILIQGYNIEIFYKEGKDNVVADALSREIGAKQKCDIPLVIECAERKKTIQDRRYSECIVLDNLLVKQEWNQFKDNRVVVTNTDHQEQIVRYFHYDILEGGHLGQNKTAKRIGEQYFWPNLKKTVHKVVSSCDTCQHFKIGKAQHLPLGIPPRAYRPFEPVHMNIIGPLPMSDSGERYIIVMVCQHSKFIISKSLCNQKSTLVIQTVLEELIFKFGTPRHIITDSGSNFLSKEFQDILSELGIEHRVSALYNQKANAQVERYVQTFMNMLRWAQFLQALSFCLNTLVFGHTPSTPSRMITRPISKYNMDPSFRETFLACWSALWKIARENNNEPPSIPNRDNVLIRKMAKDKLDQNFTGPFKVIKIDAHNAILADTQGKTRRKNIERLKQYNDAKAVDDSHDDRPIAARVKGRKRRRL